MLKKEVNYLEKEFNFQKSLINNSKDFYDNYINFLLDNLGNKCKKLTINSNDYIYFPKKIKLSNKSILIILHELSRTGAPIVALDTAKVLIKEGYFVTLISLKDGDLTNEFLELGIPVIIYNKYRYSQFSIVGYEYYFDNFEIDSFVDNFYRTIVITAANYNIIKRYIGYPKNIIWWIHEGKDTYDYIGGRMPRNITDNIKVYCGGSYSVDQLKKYGFNYNSKVLNYGVKDIDYKSINKKKNDVVRFLLAGSIGKRKGQNLLIDAINKLPKELFNKSEFIFIGNPLMGDNEGELIKAEILLLSTKYDNVKYYKSIPREEIYKLYKEIDVLVVPSTDDPMPVVATENFMYGNVVLTSNCTGTSYYIKDGKNGFVFDINNENALLEKIIYIISNKDKISTIGKNGRKTFENEFNMPIFRKKIIDIVEKEY